MATHWLQAGEQIKFVSERLDHANVAIALRIYAHILKGIQREAADRMGGAGVAAYEPATPASAVQLAPEPRIPVVSG